MRIFMSLFFLAIWEAETAGRAVSSQDSKMTSIATRLGNSVETNSPAPPTSLHTATAGKETSVEDDRHTVSVQVTTLVSTHNTKDKQSTTPQSNSESWSQSRNKFPNTAGFSSPIPTTTESAPWHTLRGKFITFSIREVEGPDVMAPTDPEKEILIQEIIYEIQLYRDILRANLSIQGQDNNIDVERNIPNRNCQNNEKDSDDDDNDDDDDRSSSSSSSSSERSTETRNKGHQGDNSNTSNDNGDIGEGGNDGEPFISPGFLKDSQTSDDALKLAMQQMSRESLEAMLEELMKLRKNVSAAPTVVSAVDTTTTGTANADDLSQLSIGDLCCSVG